MRRRASSADFAADLFALAWIAFVFVFFSLSKTKLVTYIYPLFPVAAVCGGNWLSREAGQRGVLATSYSMTAGALIGAAAIAMEIHKEDPFLSGSMVFLCALVMAPALIGQVLIFVDRRRRWLIVQSLGFALILMAVAASPLWDRDQPRVSQTAAGRLLARATLPTDRVYAYGIWKPSFVYYSGRRITYFGEQSDMAHAAVGKTLLVLVRRQDFDRDLAKWPGASYKELSRCRENLVLIQYSVK